MIQRHSNIFSEKTFVHSEFFFSVTKTFRNFISCDNEKNDDEKTKNRILSTKADGGRAGK